MKLNNLIRNINLPTLYLQRTVSIPMNNPRYEITWPRARWAFAFGKLRWNARLSLLSCIIFRWEWSRPRSPYAVCSDGHCRIPKIAVPSGIYWHWTVHDNLQGRRNNPCCQKSYRHDNTYFIILDDEWTMLPLNVVQHRQRRLGGIRSQILHYVRKLLRRNYFALLPCASLHRHVRGFTVSSAVVPYRNFSMLIRIETTREREREKDRQRKREY